MDAPVRFDLAPLRRSLQRAADGLTRDLPWIGTGNPWAVVVSEFMLQQTQTSRVVGPWQRFMSSFPTPEACAAAPLSEVLRHWEGLGFHRRAKFLHETARALCERHGGAVPSDVGALRALPGVGAYTANAIASFAFDAPIGILDTNVGRVLARAIANERLNGVEAQQLVDALVPKQGSANFNQALLDLGAQFCSATPRCESCPVKRVCRWHQDGGDDPAVASAAVSKKQKPFKGSDREIRGRLLAALRESRKNWVTLAAATATTDEDRVRRCLQGLVDDGLVVENRGRWALVGEDR